MFSLNLYTTHFRR